MNAWLLFAVAGAICLFDTAICVRWKVPSLWAAGDPQYRGLLHVSNCHSEPRFEGVR